MDNDVDDSDKMGLMVKVLQMIAALYAGQMADDEALIDELQIRAAAAGDNPPAEGISNEEEQEYIRQIEEHKQAMERAIEDLEKANKLAAEDRQALEKVKVKVTSRDREIESLRTQLDEAHAIAGEEKSVLDESAGNAKDAKLKTGSERRLDALTDAVRTRDREIERLVTDLENARLDIAGKEAQTKELQTALSELTDEVVTLTQAVAAEREEKAGMQVASDKTASLEMELGQLQSRYDILEAEREDGLGSDRTFFQKMNIEIQKLEGQLRDTVGEKDEKISLLEREIDLLNDEIDSHDTDEVEKMQREIDGKDGQIMALQNQLEEHRQDMEEQDRDLLRKQQEDAEGDSLDDNNPAILRARLKDEIDIRKKTEKKKFDWEKKYLECRTKMDRYEDETPGVREFALVIEDLRDQLDARDAEVIEKAKEANDIQRELEQVSDQCRRRACGNAEASEEGAFQHRREEEIAVLKAQFDELRRDNDRLENERLLLKKRIHQYVVVHGKLMAGADGLDAIEEETIANIEAEHLTRAQPSMAGPDLAPLMPARPSLVAGHKGATAAGQDELKRVLAEVKEQLAVVPQLAATAAANAPRARSATPGMVNPSSDSTAPAVGGGGNAGDGDVAYGVDQAVVEKMRGDALAREMMLNEQLTKVQREAEKAKFDLSTLENELKQVKASYVEKLEVPYLRLPDRMNPTSADVIANLNEHLIEVLHELSGKEQSIVTLETALVDARRQFAVVAQKQSLWYKEHADVTDELRAERDEAKTQIKGLKDALALAKVYENEFETWRNNHQDMDLREVARKSVVLKVNQVALARRYTILGEEKEHLEKEVNKYRSDVASMQRAVQGRFAYLEGYKEAAEYRIASMQDQLLNVEPKDEFEKEVRRASQLAMKLRAFLDQESRDIEHGVNAENLRHKAHMMSTENVALRKKLEFAEKNAADAAELLQVAEANAAKSSSSSSSRATNSPRMERKGIPLMAGPNDAMSGVVKGMHALELSNLKQQNSLLEMQLDREVTFARELKTRNEEVQSDFQKATTLRLSLEAAELELREQLADCVKRDKYVELEDKNNDNMERVAKLQTENAELKQTAETASRQTRDWQSLQKSQVRELTSLRERLLDMEVENDERTTIGKLHRTILALQTSENDAVRRIEDERQQRLETAARLLKLEQQLDDRNETLRRVRMDAKSSHSHLQTKLHNTRRMYAGAVTLEQQERQLTTLQKAREQKASAELELESARDKNNEAADQLATLRVEYEGVQELLLVTKEGKGAVKLADWHQKMVDARVAELQVSRKLTRELDRTKYLENLVDEAEARITSCQVELVKVREDCEHRQMQWEDRETFLEEKIEALEKLETRRELEIKQVLADFGAGVMWVPDPSKSMPEQLENAIHNLREVAQGLAREKMARQAADDDLAECRSTVGMLEAEKLRLESMVTDLRLQYHEGLPVGSAEEELAQRYQVDQAALRVAEETISSLKNLLSQKDDAAAKGRGLLSQANQEAFRTRERHAEELKAMTDRLNRLETLSAEMRSKKGLGLSGGGGGGGHAKLDEMAKELIGLRAQVSRKDQELRSHKVSTFQLQTELSNQKDALVEENIKLRDARDDFELTVRRMQVEIATLEERLASTDLKEDALKSQLLSEEEKNSMIKEKNEEYQVVVAAKDKLIAKRDATVKKLKSDMMRNGLTGGVGFGGRSSMAAGSPSMGAGSSRMSTVEETLGVQASELQERLARLNGNTTKAQAVIKKQKKKYVESEQVRRRLEGDLTKALELVRKHEDELAKAQGKMREMRQKQQTAAAALVLKDNLIEDLESESKLARERSRALAEHSSQSEADEAMIAQLQKRIRILESRGRDAPPGASLRARPPPSPRSNRPGGGGGGGGGGPPQTMEEKVVQWEVEKKRRKELEALELKVKELSIGMDAANLELGKRQARIDDLLNAAGSERESILAGVRAEHHEADRKRKKQLTQYKTKVAEQAKELSAASEQLKQMRETVSRLDREKNQLNRKLQAASKRAGNADAAGGPAEAHRLRGWQEVESLREDLVEAQRRQLTTDATVKGLMLEREQLSRRLNSSGSQPVQGERQRALDKIDGEQKKRLQSENDNVALRFELEQARTETARAQARLSGTAAADNGGERPGSSASTGTGVSNVKYMEVVKTNKKLKADLVEALAMTQPGPDAKAMKKLAAEHDKTVGRLKKNMELFEKVKGKLAASERNCQLLEEEKTMMAVNSLRHSSSSPLRTKQMPSDQMHRVEADNDILKRRLAEVEIELEKHGKVQEEVAVLRQHNQELNSELAAFDPTFFEEIEDLKYQHGNLVEENAQLKATLARMQPQ